MKRIINWFKKLFGWQTTYNFTETCVASDDMIVIIKNKKFKADTNYATEAGNNTIGE